MYHGRGYLEIVNRTAEESMQSAVAEVQALPVYVEKGEVTFSLYVMTCRLCNVMLQWVITDARHDSTANAYHTTVPCLAGR